MEAVQYRWIEERVEMWKSSVDIMAGVACKHPQTAYVGLQKSLHQEWYFLECITPDIVKAFQPVEDVLQEEFLPDLFKGHTPQISGR